LKKNFMVAHAHWKLLKKSLDNGTVYANSRPIEFKR
jgi:hypothetical protein